METHVSKVSSYYNAQTEMFYLKYWDDEDIHFGIFLPGESNVDLKKAVKRMTKSIIAPACIKPTDSVIDAGCGVGGAAIDIGKLFGCKVKGFTNSRRQVEIARKRSAQAGLENQVLFEYADCSETIPVENGSIDAIISIESACHYSDKLRFIAECARVLKNGGCLSISDWAAKDTISSDDYKTYIQPICDSWYFVSLEKISAYKEMLCNAGFDLLLHEDMWEATLENARILARARLMFLLKHPVVAGVPEEILKQWDRQFKYLSEAWLNGYFTIVRLLARKR